MLFRFLHTIAFLLINLLNLTVGEGSKPIFDRQEIKRAICETEDVEEQRTVVTVNLENLENKSKTLKRHSASLSRTRTRSPRRTSASSRHPRYNDSKHEDEGSYKSGREKYHSRERKDGERSYRDNRERSRDHSRDRRKTDGSRESPWERRQRDRPREQRVPLQRYIEHIPIYYGNFQPRPLMVGPWVPIRGLLGGNIHPPMMRPVRKFPPRAIGIPPDMYGFRPPLKPRKCEPHKNLIKVKKLRQVHEKVENGKEYYQINDWPRQVFDFQTADI